MIEWHEKNEWLQNFLQNYMLNNLQKQFSQNVSSTKSISTAAAATTMVEQKQEEGGGVGKFCNCIFNEFWQDLPQEKSFVLIPSAACYFTPAKHVYIRGSQVGLYMFTSHAFWIIESPSNTAVTLQNILQIHLQSLTASLVYFDYFVKSIMM